MSTTADHADNHSQMAAKMGFAAGQVVQELGYDSDCDEPLRLAIESVTGTDLVDEDYGDVVDGVLMWWREDEGDLEDALVDALTVLEGGGLIWLLTPKAGRDGHVEPSDIREAATTAGLSATSSLAAAADWSGTRLVPPRNARR